MFAYNYWWGLTSAQIELGLADQPFVDYKSSKEKGKHTRREMEELAKEWEEKRKARGGSMLNGWNKVKMDDVLKDK